jgi:CO dehydrogenase maturation factor
MGIERVMKTKTIAVFGKGGVGKTTISAIMLNILAERCDGSILAIDADPSYGLAFAMGFGVKKTVDDIRKDIIKSIKKGIRRDKEDTLRMLDYEVFDALTQGKKIAFLAIGRPEDEGCYCKVNYLLKDIIADLAGNFDIVLIDGEAGVEQINRRVMKTVDSLVLVSDTSAKGINVVETIRHVAHDNRAVDYQKIGLVINRARSEEEAERIHRNTSLDLLGWMPDDDLIREYDFDGRPLTDLPPSSTTRQMVIGVLEKLGF